VKYSLDEDDKESDVNAALDDNKIASASTLPISAEE